MISITSGFECGNGKNVSKIADDRYRLEVEGDRESYSFYFCFDVQNRGAATEIEVEVADDPDRGDPTGFISCCPTTIWIRRGGMDRFKPLDPDQILSWEYPPVIRFSLEADETVRVANVWPAPYSETCAFLEAIADERGDCCELFSLGKSAQGRDIVGIRTGKPRRPKVLCLAGQHPAEFTGPWGMRGIADFVTSRLSGAARLREELEVEVIPIVNPDGNVTGRSAFNAEGFDMYRAFGDDPEADEPEAHESRLLWSKVKAERPALWMNIHSYVGWRLNSEYPYDGWYKVSDPVFEDPVRRRIYRALCDTIRLETDGPSTHEKASVHRTNTLCYQMARRFGIPSVFFEINAGTAGPHGSATRALHVFRKAARTLLHCV